ncbi:hypothetical protein M1271_03910 [Patescibacteria group bacterium]|nr:hypothetical protein [Patescibacteria group bacterium]MCL5798019.1 hypothetical protein [Patescibacteria group bacterium]
MKKTDFIVIALIILFSVLTLKDLFIPGFYTSHDGIHQIVRLYYFDKLMHDGQFPPRYVGNLLYGFGYPLFSFSYQMPWFFGEPLHFAGLSVIDSVKMTFLVTYVLSGIAMFIFQKKVFGTLPAIVGTVVYQYAPYRFSNIFVRAAIGDATSFIFPPLFFLAIYMIKKGKKISGKWISLSALSIAGLLLSHAMVFFLFIICIGIYFILSYLFVPNKKLFLVSFISIGFLASGLSAYYFFPSLIERNYTVFASIFGPEFVGNTFLSIKDLIYSPWGYGMMNAKEGAMSLQVGIGQWLSVIAGFIGLIWLSLRRNLSNKEKLLRGEAFIFLVIFIFSVFLMLPLSLFLWKLISRFAIVDFTWRVLPVTVLAASYLAGFLSSVVHGREFFAFLLVLITLYAVRNDTRINQVQNWSMPFYLSLESTTNQNDEYTPQWVRSDLLKPGLPKVEFSGNNAVIDIKDMKSNYISLAENASQSGILQINRVYYPGWVAYVNGRQAQINYKDNGFMKLRVAAGRNLVEAKFMETPLRKISDILSIISLLVASYLIIRYRKT